MTDQEPEDDLLDDEDDWDPDAPDPSLVEHGLDKAILGLSVALSATDDEAITVLLEQAYGKVDEAVGLNQVKLDAT